MSEKQQTTAQPTTTKDYTPARLKIEQEYNDKRTGSGWQRYYKVMTSYFQCTSYVSTCIQEKLSYSGKKQTESEHTPHTMQANAHSHV